MRTAGDTQLYQVITIDGDEPRFKARTATNGSSCRPGTAASYHAEAGDGVSVRGR